MRKIVTGIAVAALAAAATLAVCRAAKASADADLGAGGTVAGDISAAAGDVDRVTFGAISGEKVQIAWQSAFAPDVTLVDPDGISSKLPFTAGTRRFAGIAHGKPGLYQVVVATADGSQGAYRLSVTPLWDRAVVLPVASQVTTFDVAMPAKSHLQGVVTALPGSSQPEVVSLQAPDGTELLFAPVVGSQATARVPRTYCADRGTYRLTLFAQGGEGRFRATLARTLSRARTKTVRI